MIGLTCSRCRQALTVQPNFAGRTVKCPTCGQVLRVPTSAAPIPAIPIDSQAVLELGPLAPPQAADEIGRLGRYRVLGTLGGGGMGMVYLAEDPVLRRRVALKVMNSESAARPEARQRFLREAQSIAALQHDHIITIFDVNEEFGIPFLAMPLLQGESLEDRLKRESVLPLAEVLRIGREVADGLHAAHSVGVVHRDVKPANIWLEKPRQRVKILDFGLSLPIHDTKQLTSDGLIVGTPNYMSPEQARGGVKVDHRSDLFALGITLYEASTGFLPFDGPDTLAILTALATHQPVEPHIRNPLLPQEFSNFLLSLMAKEPDERPQSAQEVAELLADLESVFVPATPPGSGRMPMYAPPGSARLTVQTGSGRLADIIALQPQIPEPLSARVTLPNKAGDLLLKGHTADVNAVAFSPDGLRLASAGLDQSVRLWDPLSGQCLLQFRAHDATVTSIAYSHDGRYLVTSGGDRLLKLWDAATGRLKKTLAGHNSDVLCVAVHPNSRLIASGGADRRIKLWNAAKGEALLVLKPHTSLVLGVTFSPDGRFLAAGAEHNTIVIWELPSGKEVLTLRGHGGLISSISISPDGRRLLSGSLDGLARIWSLSELKPQDEVVWNAVDTPEVHSLHGHGGQVLSVAFGPLYPWAATGASDQLIRLWDTHTGQMPLVLRGHAGSVRCVSFSPDGSRLASAGDDQMVRVWSMAGRLTARA